MSWKRLEIEFDLRPAEAELDHVPRREESGCNEALIVEVSAVSAVQILQGKAVAVHRILAELRVLPSNQIVADQVVSNVG
jgi:hypothetical protein